MPEPDAPDHAVNVFYSYAHEDEPLRDELAGHLKILERRGLIRAWHDRKIVAGQDWAAVIDENLESAELVLLLVSKDFMGSDYIFGVELKRAMERSAAHTCEVVPIIVRAVNIEPEDADDLPFMRLQCLPADLKPVTSWANRDEAWTHVAKGLRASVHSIRARHPRPAAAHAPGVRGVGEAVPRGQASGVAQPPTAGPADALVEGIVVDVVQQIDDAALQRTGGAVAEPVRAGLARDTRALIDVPEQMRVLWVDDHPERNRHETAALSKLQIEVIAELSTDRALLRIAADAAAGEAFDLVLTDWSRPAEQADAALALLAQLRAAGHQMPVVVYHGASEAGVRAERAARAAAAGALGVAVDPAELMRLVHQALAAQRPAQEAPATLTIAWEEDAAARTSIVYGFFTARSRAELRRQLPNPALLRALVQQGDRDAAQDAQFGHTLGRLLVPQDLVSPLGSGVATVLELDAGTAALPWELIALDAAVPPWAVRSKLLRSVPGWRRRSALQAPAAAYEILVVGEPAIDPGIHGALPGALAEARAVATLLASRANVTALLGGAQAPAVVNALMARPYRILHLAGHAEPPGMALSGGVTLGPGEFGQMHNVPELVFLSCGHLPTFDAAVVPYDRPAFAAQFAQALLAIGMRCVVVAGWRVDDASAEAFATGFYAALLAGQSFIDAVGRAREAAWHAYPTSPTWGAYQCYGDPDWTYRRGAVR